MPKFVQACSPRDDGEARTFRRLVGTWYARRTRLSMWPHSASIDDDLLTAAERFCRGV
jgi:hypothetical protein